LRQARLEFVALGRERGDRVGDLIEEVINLVLVKALAVLRLGERLILQR